MIRSDGGERGPIAVDVHGHFFVAAAAEMASGMPKTHVEPSFGAPSEQHSRNLIAIWREKMGSLDAHLDEMDSARLSVRVLSVTPRQFYYWLETDAAANLARLINEELAEAVAHPSGRFGAFGTVPLQDPARAIDEATYVRTELGFPGIEIAPSVNGVDLDAAEYAPFWDAVEQLGLTVFLHPHAFGDGRRFTPYFLANVMGNPLETSVGLSRLILGGVFERHPGLRVIAAHGGGYLASYPDRMDHAYEVRPECRQFITRKPSTYLSQVYLDTVVFNPDALRYLVDRHGTERMVLGTDYPYDMGEKDPVGLVSRVRDLSGTEQAAILAENASLLLGLKI
jgi:aminocarboxymuconate-semialdehyde decarboxylase